MSTSNVKAKATILFLEDDPVIRDVLTEYMKLSQYEVVGVADGETALEILSSQPIDLAILDIMVPKKSGLEVLSHIRENNLNLGVIMLTALDDERTQLDAFNHLADDYVIKPVSPLILMKRIDTILRRTKPDRSVENNSAKRLVVQKESYRVLFDQNPLPLTISEFLLFQTLYENPQRVFTRENLIMAIFNEEYIGNDRIIDAHVKNIRKKIPLPFIRTVTGVGYQFNEEYDL
ncbi:MAG: response regulator transcription factor [Chloroflexi bacterium]|nr:response regulator transcription factor [Chloroflexota bacterium]